MLPSTKINDGILCCYIAIRCLFIQLQTKYVTSFEVKAFEGKLGGYLKLVTSFSCTVLISSEDIVKKALPERIGRRP